MLSVGAVRPLETVAPLVGAVLNDARQPYSDSEASDDDVLSVGARAPMNRPAVCCARLDDFGHIVVRTGHRSRTDGSHSGYPCFAGRISGRVCRGSYCADALAVGC